MRFVEKTSYMIFIAVWLDADCIHLITTSNKQIYKQRATKPEF